MASICGLSQAQCSSSAMTPVCFSMSSKFTERHAFPKATNRDQNEPHKSQTTTHTTATADDRSRLCTLLKRLLRKPQAVVNLIRAASVSCDGLLAQYLFTCHITVSPSQYHRSAALINHHRQRTVLMHYQLHHENYQ